MSSLNALGRSASPGLAATKAGIIALTQNIAITYGPAGIRANAICPGDVDTELNQAFFNAHPDPAAFRRRLEREYPLRRIASPEEVARVALFLASDDASFVSGSHVVVDGALMARIYDL
jgi:NAD(P)-dependent dehydrogenase (short-subunit alcohol dehydrogenase family)